MHLKKLTLVVSLALAFNVNYVFAQDDTEEEGAELEDITVSGSGLKRANFDAIAPVVSISAEDIRRAPQTTLGDLLNELPQLRATFGLGNSGRFIGTAGGGFLDLRGLGTDRTLVLINGRRHVAGSEGSPAVDFNSIPTALVERIDIVTGANSAVYGADAVAGAINVILKDDMNGFIASGSVGQAEHGPFNRYSAALTGGFDFADNRGNAVMSVSYDKQDEMLVSDRGGRFLDFFGSIDNPLDGDTIDPDTGFQIDDGIPDNIIVPNAGFFVLSEPGIVLPFATGGIDFALNPDGSVSPINRDQFEFISDDGNRCGGVGCTPLDLDTFQQLQVPFERYSFDGNFTFELSDDLTLYSENRYSNIEASNQGQPSFDFFSLQVAPDNAFIDPSLADAIQGLPFLVGRFNTDLGLRLEDNQRQTYRSVLGLRGKFGGDWDYDIFANYGRTTSERINFNNRIDERFLAAVDSVSVTQDDIDNITTGGFLDPSIVAGDIACRASLQSALGETPVLSSGSPAPDFATQGCVPLNILGQGLASQEAIDFIMSTALGSSTIQQFQTQATIQNSDLFETWAGPVAGLLGVEYRQERSRTTGDSLSALGNTFFNALADTRGNFDVYEAFVETAVPLLKGVPGIEELTFEGAARFSDYSTIGETFTWETRLNWRPFANEDFRVRATYGEAVRAPNIGDLFAPAGENFANVADPCDFTNLDEGENGRDTRLRNCRALGIADPETFDSLDEQSIPLLQGGNPDLREEDGETLTVGIVWSPSFLDGLDFSVDYWDIRITDAISFTGAQTILNRCVDDPNGVDNQFCNLVDRDSVGNISELRNFPLNLNTFKSRGIDLGLSYLFNLGSAGTLESRVNGTFLDARTFNLAVEGNKDRDAGELGDAEFLINMNNTWIFGAWEVFNEIRFIDSQLLFDQGLLFGDELNNDPNPDISDMIRASDRVYIDIGASYNFNNGLTVQISADNLTDVKPPINLFGNGGGSGTFDNIGRFYNMRLDWAF
ncbi:MAG: TonB-dependent receptor [Gammaproteobacteria bacterium]|jgi:iron complex outermembrane receptor protein|nr:TonB-dependent receptor [Gammaproteobacteria bacterium]